MATDQEKIKFREMRKRFINWPDGYFCYICGEPIDKGVLCNKHANYFNAEGVQENQEYVFQSTTGISIKSVHDCI